MADFTTACKAADVPEGKMKAVTVNGKKILVANIGGKYCAMSSVCTHKGGPLEQGQLKDGVVTCPWHGGQFDVCTGAVKNAPPTTPASVFETTVENGDVKVKA